MEWINIKKIHPNALEDVIVLAKEGNYFKEIHGKIDKREIKMYCGFFYNKNANLRIKKIDLCFQVDCGCSGMENDPANLEVLYWIKQSDLPKIPKE